VQRGVSAKRGRRRGKCKERNERGYFPAERGQVEPGVEEMKIEVKNRKFPRRSEWK
jgi:hypothetical protein